MRRFNTFVGMVALVGAAACGEESSPVDPTPPLLEPPAEGKGIQVSMVTTVEAGTEVEHCQFVRAPAEGINVNRDEVKYSGGSHHVLLYNTEYTEIPTVDEQGDAVDTSGVFDCSDGVNFRWRLTSLLAGSQNADGDSSISFPDNVAIKVKPNAILLMNAHYINASGEPVQPEAAINLHSIPDEQVEHEGGLLFWYNPFIKVAAKGDGLAQMTCPLPSDITLENAQSHMHKRGMGYEASLIAPDGTREKLYENSTWEAVPVERWEGGFPVKAGSQIEFKCDYQNTEDRTIWQGPRTSDEMCMFIGSYWPAQDHINLCSSDPENALETQSMAAQWEGFGEATCGDTLGCLQKIEQDASFDEFLQGATDCIFASAPEEGPYVSAGISCLLTHADPINECSAELQACLNHD